MATFTFEITPLYMGIPQPEETYIVEVDEETAEDYRAGGNFTEHGEWSPNPWLAREF